MNIEKEINSILEKFIIHLYDNFDFEEAKLKIECELKIASELKDYYYTEEELYDMYIEMEYVLEHNFNLLKTKQFKTRVEFIDD